MLSVTAKIKNIRFKNIYGGFRCYAINADAARYCMTPLFEEDDYPDGVGEIREIYFDNFVCFPVVDLPEYYLGASNEAKIGLKLESHMDNFNIKGFKYICDNPTKYCIRSKKYFERKDMCR